MLLYCMSHLYLNIITQKFIIRLDRSAAVCRELFCMLYFYIAVMEKADSKAIRSGVQWHLESRTNTFSVLELCLLAGLTKISCVIATLHRESEGFSILILPWLIASTLPCHAADELINTFDYINEHCFHQRQRIKRKLNKATLQPHPKHTSLSPHYEDKYPLLYPLHCHILLVRWNQRSN